jgi:hypothetical protein
LKKRLLEERWFTFDSNPLDPARMTAQLVSKAQLSFVVYSVH